MEGTDAFAHNVQEFPSILLDSGPLKICARKSCFSDLLLSCLHYTNPPWLCIWRVEAVISSPKQPKLKSEYLTVRPQPLDVLSVGAIVYDKSTEGKYRDPDSLCFHHFGLRSVLIRPTAAFDSSLNPVRLLGSKPRRFKYSESTYGMVWHASSLSQYSTCKLAARSDFNPQLWLGISFSLQAAGLSKLGEWLQINVQTHPPKECARLYWKRRNPCWGKKWKVPFEMNWELHARDGTNQASLVNVSIFHHEIIINTYYYKVPHVGLVVFFFPFSYPPPFSVQQDYQYLWTLYC